MGGRKPIGARAPRQRRRLLSKALAGFRKAFVSASVESRLGALGSFELPETLGNTAPHTLVASLCTIKSRVETVHSTIESLLRQDLVPDEIHLYISREPYLLDDGIQQQDLPTPLARLAEAGLVQIRTTPNIGSLRKLDPALRAALESDRSESTLILCTDDDYLYPPHFVSTYYRHHLLHPDSVKGVNCRRATFDETGRPQPYKTWPAVDRATSPSLGLWIVENHGCLVPSKLIEMDYFSDAWQEMCPASGETWLNAYLWRKRIPVTPVVFRQRGFRRPFRYLTAHHAERTALGRIYALARASQASEEKTLTWLNLDSNSGAESGTRKDGKRCTNHVLFQELLRLPRSRFCGSSASS